MENCREADESILYYMILFVFLKFRTTYHFYLITQDKELA